MLILARRHPFDAFCLARPLLGVWPAPPAGLRSCGGLGDCRISVALKDSSTLGKFTPHLLFAPPFPLRLSPPRAAGAATAAHPLPLCRGPRGT